MGLVHLISVDVTQSRVGPGVLFRHHVVDPGPQFVVGLEESDQVLQLLEVGLISMQKVLFSRDLLLQLLELIDFCVELVDRVHDTLVECEVGPLVYLSELFSE